MEELVKYIAQNLVDNPEQVEVTREEAGGEIIIKLRVAAADTGKVIGKQGRIAKAIRVVVKAASAKSSKRYNVEIM